MAHLNGKRVLVTGGAGFLGKAVCAEISQQSPKTLVVPRSAEYDLCQPEAVRAMIAKHRPDTVIHLAAVVGGIGANMKNPGRYFYANAAMGIHLMEECRLAGVEKYVQIGTVCAYPKFTPIPFREEDIWNGFPEETNAPYGIAKKMLIVQAQAYRQQYGMNAISVIPVNLYGPGDNFDPQSSHVIPALIRKAIEARDTKAPTLSVWGTGSASREFLFVRDAAKAIVLATDRYNGDEPVNIGSGSEIRIRELAEMICDLSGYKGSLLWDKSKPDGQPRRCLDTTRAQKHFGFTAQTSLEEGMRETIDWFENSFRQSNIAA